MDYAGGGGLDAVEGPQAAGRRLRGAVEGPQSLDGARHGRPVDAEYLPVDGGHGGVLARPVQVLGGDILVLARGKGKGLRGRLLLLLLITVVLVLLIVLVVLALVVLVLALVVLIAVLALIVLIAVLALVVLITVLVLVLVLVVVVAVIVVVLSVNNGHRQEHGQHLAHGEMHLEGRFWFLSLPRPRPSACSGCLPHSPSKSRPKFPQGKSARTKAGGGGSKYVLVGGGDDERKVATAKLSWPAVAK